MFNYSNLSYNTLSSAVNLINIFDINRCFLNNLVRQTGKTTIRDLYHERVIKRCYWRERCLQYLHATVLPLQCGETVLKPNVLLDHIYKVSETYISKLSWME